MGRLTRRIFLTRLGATAVALTLARHLPGIAPTPLTLTPPNGVYAGASFQRGDVFTIEGRYAFDSITQKPTGTLQRFIVTDVVTAGPLPEELISFAPDNTRPYTNTQISHDAPEAVVAEPVEWWREV